jgi:Lysine methyltransferase
MWSADHRHCLRFQVVDHAWGEDVAALLPQGRPPDVITGADIIYEERHYPALLATLRGLAAPHTLIYLASRLRGASGIGSVSRLD